MQSLRPVLNSIIIFYFTHSWIYNIEVSDVQV